MVDDVALMLRDIALFSRPKSRPVGAPQSTCSRDDRLEPQKTCLCVGNRRCRHRWQTLVFRCSTIFGTRCVPRHISRERDASEPKLPSSVQILLMQACVALGKPGQCAPMPGVWDVHISSRMPRSTVSLYDCRHGPKSCCVGTKRSEVQVPPPTWDANRQLER